jgi:FeS assembly SUF system protein
MDLREQVIAEIRKIYDPEIPVNIYELGLIYDVKIENNNTAKIIMTLTSPNCPVAESLPQEVKDSAMQVDGIEKVDLDLVFEPPWDKSMMSEAAKLELNL